MSSFGTNDWVPTQWLPQVVMAQLENWFGLPGVAWFQGLLHLALAVTFWVVARRWSTPLVERRDRRDGPDGLVARASRCDRRSSATCSWR